MSKMGISVLNSYQGAQTFEAIGIGREVVDFSFTGVPSKIGGIGFAEIAEESIIRHRAAFETDASNNQPLDLGDPGYNRYRKSGERHVYTTEVIKNFHTYVKSGRPEDYEEYVRVSLETKPVAIKDLIEFVPSVTGPIPLEEVEPMESIRRRFTTAAMSLGALSPEAHETLAIAMNRIGGKSDSGEGGEDPARYRPYPNGDYARSYIKQIASGRFGVSAYYLVNADELEIKMAQGAKPGEGGQLPGHKVNALIARLRNTQPGVQLISPPPHHDIYSIEDLAQLIHDLKEVNPRARITVKLVAESGVGTVAAGVRQGLGGQHSDFRPRRRHRSLAAFLDETRRLAMGTRFGGSPADAAHQQPARPRHPPHRRRHPQWPRRGHRRHSRGRAVQFRHHRDDRHGLRLRPQVPPQHLPGRHRHHRSEIPRQIQGHAGNGHQLLQRRRQRGPGNHGQPGNPQPR